METTIGSIINQKRKELGIKQAALADVVGISRPFMSEIENGKKTPAADTLMKIFQALGISNEAIYKEHIAEHLNEAQQIVIRQSMKLMDLLNKHVPKDELHLFMMEREQEQQYINSLQSVLAGEPMAAAPEGWLKLSSANQKLVQRIVNICLQAQGEED